VGILDALQVPDGLEAAFGAGFGEASEAALDEGAAKFFRALPASGRAPADLPADCRFFDTLIDAPPALARALQSLVLLERAEDGDSVQTRLPPGMSAVTREGACWRWDGQVIRAGAPNAAAVRLRQANRLRVMLTARDAAAGATEKARAGCLAAAQDERAAQVFEDEARAAHAESETRLRAARDTAAAVSAQAAQAEARRAMLLPVLQRLAASCEAAQAALALAEQGMRALVSAEDPAEALAFARRRAEVSLRALDEARTVRAAARGRRAEAQSKVARLREEAREAEARIHTHGQRAERARADHAAAQSGRADAEAAMARLPDLEAIQAARYAAAQAEAGAQSEEDAARHGRAAAERTLEMARSALAALQRDSVQAEGRVEAVRRVLARGVEDLRLAEAALQAASARVSALPQQDGLIAAQDAARMALDGARKDAFEARARLHAIESELQQAEAARTLAAHDLAGWQTRLDDATARGARLAGRRDAARAAHKALADAPAAIAARSEKSLAALQEAETAHRAAHDRLAAVEQRVRALALARRDAELLVASRREGLLRAEAASDAAQGALEAVLARAAERLGADAAIPEAGDESDEAEEKARKKFERLTRERDEMGPVNLRAELELDELDQRLATLEQEREELNIAIAKLRGSIGHLNREGRARLEVVFQQVDQHFRTLFTRMMGGGRAHLALTGSDDPLMAGLEIYAEPPGKKLSALSLLSGGEQALTALSLIFAVFRCTPAPISVLDEVDAPLDDANVERFCTLLDDVVRDTGTRFLVVTHHQLTMSRMDRLFGVTMQERGVSRLLSVDLQRAAAMVEPQLQAAE
jgi:chromosome segregation protein